MKTNRNLIKMLDKSDRLRQCPSDSTLTNRFQKSRYLNGVVDLLLILRFDRDITFFLIGTHG